NSRNSRHGLVPKAARIDLRDAAGQGKPDPSGRVRRHRSAAFEAFDGPQSISQLKLPDIRFIRRSGYQRIAIYPENMLLRREQQETIFVLGNIENRLVEGSDEFGRSSNLARVQKSQALTCSDP